MAVNRAIGVLYQNQMQFNLDVPLTASNIASHCHKPGPIMVERVGGRSAIPGNPHIHQTAPKNPNVSASSSFNYTTLSEDTMAKVSQLAKRDLKNRRLQMQRERDKSPSADCIVLNQRRQQPKLCARQRKPVANKPRTPLRAREADKNRRIGNVQTPPPARKPKPSSSNSQIADDSMYSNIGGGEDSKQTDNFFPVKPMAKPNNYQPAGPKDEIGKLQQELESYLQTLCRIEQQVLRDGSAGFLQNRIRGKAKNNFLTEEEDVDRVRMRAGEQNTRSTRNMYNLCQKVKQLQREVSQADLSKPTKKSQIIAQLNATYRGAVRALQVFVNQLPYQDLHMGLPSTYNELALLLRQLTTLMTLTQQGSKAEGEDGSDVNVLALLDQVDDFNSKWCSMALQYSRAGQPLHRRPANNVVQREWVSDTKVDSDLLSKNVTEFTAKRPAAVTTAPKKSMTGAGRPVLSKQQGSARDRRPRPVGRTTGKENRLVFGDEGSTAAVPTKPSLAGQKTFGFVSRGQASKSLVKDIDTTKGYMLPPELMAKRERAQRAVELSNKNFSESTHSSRLKATGVQRPQSAPSPGRKKEVNFDLREEKMVHQPWIPAGRAPRREQRPRSSSAESRHSSAERSPFYVTTLDGQEIWDVMPDRHARSVTSQGKPRSPAYGYRSLPTDTQLRSTDVSESVIDLIEKRILYRMLQGKSEMGGMHQSTKDQMLYSSNEALDITDLTVDKSYSYDDTSLNTTAEAASMVDAPTLENIRLKLADMERTKREIRQRWSTLNFIDTRSKSKSVFNNCPEDPPSIDYSTLATSKTKQDRQDAHQGFGEPINKGWVEEPLLFTKPKAKSNVHANKTTAQTPKFPPKVKPQVTLHPATLDRIMEDRERFEEHLRKRSHHPVGKFDPWTLMEEISEEILKECLQEVSDEVEKISEEMANQMYKSEFMVTGRPSETHMLDQEPPIDQGYPNNIATEAVTAQNVHEYHPSLGGDHEMIFEDYGVGREFVMDDEESPRSPVSSANGFEPLSRGVASEPFLDNVSQLVQERVEGLVEHSEDDDGDEDGGRKGNDDQEDEEDEDDDDEDYSDDEFENVSDVEL